MKIAPEYSAIERLHSCKDRLTAHHPECAPELAQQYEAFVFLMTDEQGKQIEWSEDEISEFEREFHTSMHSICEQSATKMSYVFALRN